MIIRWKKLGSRVIAFIQGMWTWIKPSPERLEPTSFQQLEGPSRQYLQLEGPSRQYLQLEGPSKRIMKLEC